jgi:hypothetical protein
MGILRQKDFLKAEKKRKKKVARQNKRKRKREEAEKMKQDLTVDISQQESTKEMLPIKIRNFKFNLNEASFS